MSAAFKFDDKAWRRIVTSINGAAKLHVKVGIIGDETNATIATVHEYGSPANNIPERSFMRSTLTNERVKIGRLQAKAVAAVVAGKISARLALDKIGAYVAGAMQANVVNGDFAPLAPATIKAKGSDKPLIDTGQMVGAISWKVEE
jgi:hypothetical protein